MSILLLYYPANAVFRFENSCHNFNNAFWRLHNDKYIHFWLFIFW